METYTFTLTHEAVKVALIANGWSQLWNENNWVHESDKNPDWSGVDIATAFERLLREKNLL